ncbi:MAG: ABC transporter ATP-binding protein [Candidatus Theseobacter exili]|nr:ABC transporter ATP-binding protein [Candidatus Theseobacter exili]
MSEDKTSVDNTVRDKDNFAIKVKDLTRSFDGRKVLDGVSLDIRTGETMVIMGTSGCGKSTLLRHMIGALTPDEGNVHLCGKDITQMNECQMNEIRKRFGMLYQSGALFNSMNVGENVAFPLRQHTDLDEEIIRIIVKIKLELVGLTGFEKLMPSQISGGMKKRVGLARAISMDPEIVFYDEPGAGLDPITAAVIDLLIMDLTKKLGITSIVVTHEMASIFRIADRIAMLHEGKVVETGTPESIKNSTNPIVQQFITGSAEGPIPMRRTSEDFLEGLSN